MRMLNSAEMVVVAGGHGALPPCPPCPPAGCPWGDDVVIPGRPLPSRRSPNATTGAFDPIVISGSINLQLFALSWQAQMDAEALLRMEAGRPGVIDGSEGIGDTIKGIPVDHHSDKDSLDYRPEWEKVLGKMSALERSAFASALEYYGKRAGDIDEDGVKEFLKQLAHAVLSNAPGWAGDASSRASQNLSQGELGMFEVFVTAAYASSASLPGGI